MQGLYLKWPTLNRPKLGHFRLGKWPTFWGKKLGKLILGTTPFTLGTTPVLTIFTISYSKVYFRHKVSFEGKKDRFPARMVKVILKENQFLLEIDFVTKIGLWL